MTDISNIIQSNRFFEIQRDVVLSLPEFDIEFYGKVEEFTVKYLQYLGISPEDAGNRYLDFLKQYSSDIKEFGKSSQYPFEKDEYNYNPSVSDYHISLLFSILFTPHRYKLFSCLFQIIEPGESALTIGCGPGFELTEIGGLFSTVEAYDLGFLNFMSEIFPEISIHKKEWIPELRRYDAVFLIEFLEHIHNPFEFLQKAADVLNKNGIVYFTTAINIPQFDHVYKFKENNKQIAEQLVSMGLVIEKETEIPHATSVSSVSAMNVLYKVRKA